MHVAYSSDACQNTQGTLTLHRSEWTEPQQESFQQLVDADDFYRLRIPSQPNQPESPPVVASLRARCLVKDGFQARAASGASDLRPIPQQFMPSDMTCQP